MKSFYCLLLFSLSAAYVGCAQIIPDTTSQYLIETIDGNEYFGNIIYQDSLSIHLKTEVLGEITIPANTIKNLQMISPEQMKDGTYWLDYPQDARYFWAPNGYGIKAGEAYYQNIWVFYNQFTLGVTDYFSCSAGIVPLFLFAGAPTPVWIVPKFSIPVVKDKLNLGAGALAGYVLGDIDSSKKGFGILFGNITIGSRHSNLTVGVGYGFAAGEFANRPIINISGMARVSAKTHFITENYYMSIDDNSLIVISAGGRSMTNKVSLSYGLILPFQKDMDVFVAIPWLGITVPLGKAKPK